MRVMVNLIYDKEYKGYVCRCAAASRLHESGEDHRSGTQEC